MLFRSILAQVPDSIRAGVNVVQVRSLATAQASDPVLVTVERPAAGRPGMPEQTGEPGEALPELRRSPSRR